MIQTPTSKKKRKQKKKEKNDKIRHVVLAGSERKQV